MRRPDFRYGACPGCETRRRRLEPTRPEPTVWFDTMLCDWVLQVPWPDECSGTVLPLEIRWFDADWADVHRAAADLVYGDEVLAPLD